MCLKLAKHKASKLEKDQWWSWKELFPPQGHVRAHRRHSQNSSTVASSSFISLLIHWTWYHVPHDSQPSQFTFFALLAPGRSYLLQTPHTSSASLSAVSLSDSVVAVKLRFCFGWAFPPFFWVPDVVGLFRSSGSTATPAGIFGPLLLSFFSWPLEIF